MTDGFLKILGTRKGLTLIAIVCFLLSQAVPTGFAATTTPAIGIQAELNQPQPSTLAQKNFLAETASEPSTMRTPSTIPVLDFLVEGDFPWGTVWASGHLPVPPFHGPLFPLRTA